MSAKREAHLAAAKDQDRAEAAVDASGARTEPTWPIAVHLTPFAPGCERLRIDDKRRWRTFYGRTPDQVVRSVLGRLSLPPSACQAAREASGDIALLSAVRPELLKLVSSTPGELVPHALFWDGLTEDQLKTCLTDLTGRGWKPAAQLPA